MFNVQNQQQDYHTSTLKQRFQKKKSFAGAGIWTHNLLTHEFLNGHYFLLTRDLRLFDRSLCNLRAFIKNNSSDHRHHYTEHAHPIEYECYFFTFSTALPGLLCWQTRLVRKGSGGCNIGSVLDFVSALFGFESRLEKGFFLLYHYCKNAEQYGLCARALLILEV